MSESNISRQAIPPQFELSLEKHEKYDLDTLIEKKFYFHAARKAQEELVALAGSDDSQKIFNLWYVRLSSLSQARLNQIAREESRVLGDLGSEIFRDESGKCIVPWKLRVLVVPLQARGNNQIGLSKYYALCREALIEAKRDQDSSDIWRERMQSLGLYVAAMLVGMKDHLAAIEHLKSMFSSAESSENITAEFKNLITTIIGICYLQIGNTLSARQWFAAGPGSEVAKASVYSSLCSIADADWPSAIRQLEECEKSDVILNNAAIAKLHEGDLQTAINQLEELVKNGCVDHITLFNLFTLYDLGNASAKERKSEALESLKSLGNESLGSYEFMVA